MLSIARYASFLVLPVAFHCTLTSCATDQADVAASSRALEGPLLTFDVLNDKELSGSYESGLGVVKLFGYAESDTKLSALALVNGTQIDIYATSDDGGHVGFQVHGGKLDEAAHELLAAVHMQLAERFPYPVEGSERDDTPPHVQLLRSYVGFLSEAPPNMRDEVNDTRISPADLRDPEPGTKTGSGSAPTPTPPPPPPPCSEVLDNDGITVLSACCNGGAVVAWQHDNLPGGHCFTTMTGICGTAATAAPCAGRCGPGCFSLPGYTQDCLDQDLCLLHDASMNAGIATPDGKCGDEWWESADDFAFTYAQWASLFGFFRSLSTCPT